MKTNQRFVAFALLAAFSASSFANAQDNQSIFKKKWNPEAKGTAIGAGVGGVAGAIINKRDRKVGAGVGLAVGAAAGYGVGKIISNKQKRAAAAAAAAEQREREAEQREYAAQTAPARHVSTGGSSAHSRSVAHRATTPVARPIPSQQALAEAEMTPAETTASLTRNGYLLNTSFGDQSTAYPDSEYRRKSW